MQNWLARSVSLLAALTALSGCFIGYDEDCDPYWDEYCGDDDSWYGDEDYCEGARGWCNGQWYGDDDGGWDTGWEDDDGGTGAGGAVDEPRGELPPSDCEFPEVSLAGSVGGICDIDQQVWGQSAVVTPEVTTVELHAADCGANWSAMVSLTLEGDVMGPAWAVGTKHLVRSPAEPCHCTDRAPPVTVQASASANTAACGDDPFGWDTHLEATIVEIEVVPGSAEHTRKFVFIATFFDGSQVTGAFDLDCSCS